MDLSAEANGPWLRIEHARKHYEEVLVSRTLRFVSG